PANDFTILIKRGEAMEGTPRKGTEPDGVQYGISWYRPTKRPPAPRGKNGGLPVDGQLLIVNE
ncbi:MAG: hypothetical protein NT166_06240, partial [Candidatus Aminicenantes bacterium]|nr:hypothetical protein [Candidatus Aminicenantes bacterium]